MIHRKSLNLGITILQVKKINKLVRMEPSPKSWASQHAPTASKATTVTLSRLETLTLMRSVPLVSIVRLTTL